MNELCPKALTNKPFNTKQALREITINSFPPQKISELKRQRWKETIPGKNHKERFSLHRLRWYETPPTIQKSVSGSAGMMHPDECRELFTGELKRIGFFHHDFSFLSWESSLNRIGNSVPPGLMRAVALNVRHHLFNGPPFTPYPKSMSYLDILEATWQDHLKPKDANATTVISTFAGGGGSSLGYSMAGFKELLAVEIDNNAVETFKLNFPEVPVFHGDIGKLSVEECMKRAGLTSPGELDVFDGSPPCQGFSTAGKRAMTDDRNQLFREYVRLLRGLHPKAFIMENVSGMVKGKMKIIFAEILRELKDSGYEVKAWLLNAKYFYVPQSRERMIFIGVRKDYLEKLNADSL